jgi:transposase
MDSAAVIAAYHDLWQAEASFRMTKSDLRARPVFHHEREAIEAHLTVVFGISFGTDRSVRRSRV